MYDANKPEYEVVETEVFKNWHKNITDVKTHQKITLKIRKMAYGNFGKTKSLKDRLFETKIDYGPGYRLYFVNQCKKIIVLLCGGDKGSQQTDIKQARKMAKEI